MKTNSRCVSSSLWTILFLLCTSKSTSDIGKTAFRNREGSADLLRRKLPYKGTKVFRGPTVLQTCVGENESCQENDACCQDGLICVNLGMGGYVCKVDDEVLFRSNTTNSISTMNPSTNTSRAPSFHPTNLLTDNPVIISSMPSIMMSLEPSSVPSTHPSVNPSASPTNAAGTLSTEDASTVVKFLAFGDTPYDPDSAYPFIGPQYVCVEQVILPGAKGMANEVDFIVHVGDVKKGSARYSTYCDDVVFGNRRDLFSAVEPDLDFFLVVGDNEWNECAGYDIDPHISDEAKNRWREHFTTGYLGSFNRQSLPYGGDNIRLLRQPGKPENFFFYYPALDIAFFGVTEPASDPEYNSINANWIVENLVGKDPKAIVVFGHARIGSSSPVLKTAIPRSVPTLYVQGNAHVHSMGNYFSDSRQSEWPFLGQLTVPAFKAHPFEITILKHSDGKHTFGAKQLNFRDPQNLC